MPEYKFKCKKCKRVTGLTYRICEIAKFKGLEKVGYCVPKCGNEIRWEDVQVEFAGAVNMSGAKEAGVSKRPGMSEYQRKYNNKAGGPVGLSGNKVVGRTGLM